MPSQPARNPTHRYGGDAAVRAATELTDEFARMERQLAEARASAHGSLCRLGLVTAEIERETARDTIVRENGRANELTRGIRVLRAGIGQAFAAIRPRPAPRR